MYSLRCRLKRGLLRDGDTVVVVVVMMVVVGVAMMVVRNDVAAKFMTFAYYGLSNDRCDGSSSKNECNRKFNLSHFLRKKCEEGLAINAKVV